MEEHDLNFSHVELLSSLLNIGDFGRRYQVWECTGDIMELGISCGLLWVTEANIFTRGQPCRLLLLLRHRWSTPLLFSTWGLVSSFVLTQFHSCQVADWHEKSCFSLSCSKVGYQFFLASDWSSFSHPLIYRNFVPTSPSSLAFHVPVWQMHGWNLRISLEKPLSYI